MKGVTRIDNDILSEPIHDIADMLFNIYTDMAQAL